MALGGPALTICAGLIIAIVYFGSWPAAQAADRLRYIGVSLWIVWGLLGFVIVASTAGLVKGLDVSLGILKASVDLSDDDEPPRKLPPADASSSSSSTVIVQTPAPPAPAQPAPTAPPQPGGAPPSTTGQDADAGNARPQE